MRIAWKFSAAFMETRNLAIMFTDIKGFTSKTAGMSRAETEALLQRHSDLVLPVLGKLGGRVVKTIGDAFLVAFNSPTDAVICGVEIQSVLRAYNSKRSPQDQIEIRIAINAGDVAVHDDGDIYGDPVNIASRLESIAEPGEVFFTEAVYLAMNKKEVPYSEIGYRQFKGVTEKIKVYRVLQETPVGGHGQTVPAPRQDETEARPAGFWRRAAALAADLAIVLLTLSAIGIVSISGGVRTGDGTVPSLSGMKVKDFSLSGSGVSVSGDKGELISFNRTETRVADSAGNTLTASNDVRVWGDRRKAPLIALVWALYCSLLMWGVGGTPGMKILKLRAVDHATGEGLPPGRIFLRGFFSLISALVLLGYFWALWERNRRTWHDLVSGSRLVRY